MFFNAKCMSQDDDSDMGRRNVLRTIGIAGATGVGATGLLGTVSADPEVPDPDEFSEEDLPPREQGRLAVHEAGPEHYPHIGPDWVEPKSAAEVASTHGISSNDISVQSYDIVCVSGYCLSVEFTVSYQEVSFSVSVAGVTIASGSVDRDDGSYCADFSYSYFSGEVCLNAGFDENGVFVEVEAELCVGRGWLEVCEDGSISEYLTF